MLWGLPLLLGTGVALAGWRLRDVGSLIAGASLLAGMLVAVLVQLVVWRDRLAESEREVPRKRLDEAVALTLLTAIVAVTLAAVLAVLANLPLRIVVLEVDLLPWVRSPLTGIAVAAGLNVVVSFLAILNLVWDAYTDRNKPASKRHTKDTQTTGS